MMFLYCSLTIVWQYLYVHYSFKTNVEVSIKSKIFEKLQYIEKFQVGNILQLSQWIEKNREIITTI